ncbi:D-alanyl-D-alanine carboxypeptidase family protein [candidate division KSB1 bacterium]
MKKNKKNMLNNEPHETVDTEVASEVQSTDSRNYIDDKFGSMVIRLGVLGGLLAISIFVFNSEPFNIKKTDVVATPTQAVTQISPFEHIFIEAKAAYVYDLSDEKILFSKNEHSQLPLASITKLMTALVASKLISEDTVVTITNKSIAVDGDNGFHTDEKWNFKDLLDYTLLVSSNDGAHAIAGVAGAFVHDTEKEDNRLSFIEDMNNTALSLGLAQTYFINESGLDTSTQTGGGYGSARDIASLLAYIISEQPSLLSATAYESQNFVSGDGFIYNATNTNAAIGKIPGLIASKTGFTELAGGNLAIAFDAGINHPVVAVVLGSSFEGRFRDIEKLVKTTLEDLSQ